MRRRGFTLIEIVIVLAILGTISTPFLALSSSTYREFKSISMVAALKTDCDQAGYQVLHAAAGGGAFHVDADNHGVAFANSVRVHWERGGLTVNDHGQVRTLPWPHVTDCCLVRDGQTLDVTVWVAGPQRPGGAPMQSYGSYRYPEVEGHP
jgi:prepilin-type N-terminal cleavage/methylation domain-containing protein